MKLDILNKISKYDNAIFLIAVIVITAFYTYSIGQDGNFDLLNYHYFTGYSYLTDRIRDIAPANIQSFTHPAMNVLAYIAFDKLVFPFSAWFILFFQLLSIPALLMIADEISISMTGKRIGVEKNIALLLCIISPLWLSELGTSFFSSTTTPLILWSLYFILRQNKKAVIEGLCAGLFMGLSLGLKLTNAPFVMGAIFSVIVKVLLQKKTRWTFFVSFGLGGPLGVCITSHWYWELWLTWGNPLFPFYNKIFKSPFFEFTNWRDTRWMFNGLLDYAKFTLDANNITAKTSEVAFKDSRIFLISVAPLFFIFKIKELIRNQTIILVTFFYISYVLWAILFAYQRYAIPLEITYGLIIWITLHSLFRNKHLNTILLIIITLITLSHFKIPNWGHIPPNKIAKNPFSLVFPKGFDNKPAYYLVDGVTISHVLENLNPESIFVGVRFSDPVNTLIKKSISENHKLPVRIITTESAIQNINSLKNKFGLDDNQLDCNKITSPVGNYFVCSLIAKPEKFLNEKKPLSLNYIKEPSGESNSRILAYTEGLGDYEKDGRWTIGAKTTWNFLNCINGNDRKLIIVGSAYGANIGKTFHLIISGQTYSFVMKGGVNEVVINIENPENQCISNIELDIPSPTSPEELGQSSDIRKLGLQIKSLTVR